MKRVQPDDPQLRGLRISDFVDYLKDHGWALVSHPNKGIFLFDGPPDDNGEPFKLLLPRHTGFLDAPLRLAEAVTLVAALEERPADEIIREIKQETGRAGQSAEKGDGTQQGTRWNWLDRLALITAALGFGIGIGVGVNGIILEAVSLEFVIAASLIISAINSLLLIVQIRQRNGAFRSGRGNNNLIR